MLFIARMYTVTDDDDDDDDDDDVGTDAGVGSLVSCTSYGCWLRL